METNMTRQPMYDQIVSQPALLREVCERAEPLVKQALEACRADRWRSIYLAGCGDSYYAGLACEMAFAQFCRLPVKALPSMSFARYEAAMLPEGAVLFGISNSGGVARSIEAVAMAKAAGADTIAITGRPESRIAQEADTAIAVPIDAMGHSPGIRSYAVQLLSLFLCAIELGVQRAVLSSQAAATWRRQLRDVAAGIEATIEANDAVVKQLAETLREQENWVFVGAGPSYATALFSAAKLVESCGANAWAQDLEEWAHIQFFNRQERTPTCFIIPPGPSVERAQELLPYVKAIGRYTLLVTHQPETFDVSHADYILAVPPTVPEVFSPLVDCIAGELLAYYLAEGWDTTFFTATRRGVSAGGDRLRGSNIWRQLEALHASRATG
jgi:glutamine---fructose-6-phosphate transaminase (isomerizing)